MGSTMTVEVPRAVTPEAVARILCSLMGEEAANWAPYVAYPDRREVIPR